MANKRVVALDVGTTHITAVQGIVDGRTAIVEKIASMRTPTGAVRSNGIHNVTALAEALKELWRTHDFQTKDVIAGIQSRRVQSGVKWVEFFHPEDLAAVASPEWVKAQNILPSAFESNAVSVFHYVLRERVVRQADSAKPDPRELLVAAVVVPKDEPQALANAIEDAGLELVGMDLTAFGSLRGTALVPRESTRSEDIVIDIGSTFATLIMHVNGNIRALATIPGIGGDSVTEHVKRELTRVSSLTPHADKAEDFKTALAMLESNQPNDPTTAAIQQAVRAHAQGLVREINQVLERFDAATNNISGQVEEQGLQSVTLIGGGGALHGLVQALSDPAVGGLNIPVTVGATSQSFAWADGSGRIPPYVDGVSVVSALGLLLADRKAA